MSSLNTAADVVDVPWPLDRETFVGLIDGLRWLYDTPPQPAGALMTHHGVFWRGSYPTSLDRLSWSPTAARRLPVVVIQPTEVWADASRVVDVLAQHVAVADWWNGTGTAALSVGLARAADPLAVQLVDRYRAGCRLTGDDHDTGSVFCGCGWQARGRRAVRLPAGW